MKTIVVLCVLVLSLAGCAASALQGISATATPAPTATPICEAAAFLKSHAEAMSEFNDLINRAGATSRISLSPVIGQMQDVRRNYDKLDAPPCARELKRLVTLGMNDYIQSFIDFMAQKPDSTVKSELGSADDDFKRAVTELEKVRAASAK